MRKLYLILAIIGYLIPNFLMLVETIENKNILLWTRPSDTITALFINRISTIFAIDLLFAVLVFFIWLTIEGKKLNMKNTWKYILFTLLFGLAGTFPLFLWAREKYLNKK